MTGGGLTEVCRALLEEVDRPTLMTGVVMPERTILQAAA